MMGKGILGRFYEREQRLIVLPSHLAVSERRSASLCLTTDLSVATCSDHPRSGVDILAASSHDQRLGRATGRIPDHVSGGRAHKRGNIESLEAVVRAALKAVRYDGIALGLGEVDVAVVAAGRDEQAAGVDHPGPVREAVGHRDGLTAAGADIGPQRVAGCHDRPAPDHYVDIAHAPAPVSGITKSRRRRSALQTA